jgi:AbrB family looped-hinge helix DNA binding protein
MSSKGQITIPAEFRRKAGVGPNDLIEIAFDDGSILITKLQRIDHVWNAGQSAMLTEWNDEDQNVYNGLALS